MVGVVAYFAPILTLMAALVALIGPSRKPDKIGVRGLTLFGWCALGFALTSAAIATFNVHAQQSALGRAESELARMRRVAQNEFADGIGQVLDVLKFAALMPYTTLYTASEAPPLPLDEAGGLDLRGERTLADLAQLRLAPGVGLNGPYIPSAVPFGTTTRSAMDVLEQESARAIESLRNAQQIYAARATDAEVLEAASALVNDSFLQRLTMLHQKYAERSTIEDSSSPDIVNLYFLDDTAPNPSPQRYLDLLDKVDRLRAALEQLTADQ